MRINHLHIEFFKNYQKEALSFDSRIVSLVGPNGAGKTNIIDAIHYLSVSKSAFGGTDLQNIHHGHHYFLLKGDFGPDNSTEVKCYLERHQKKLMTLNDVPYERLSDHVGSVPLVLSSPYDQDMIRDASEIRRKWVDGCISQVDSGYLRNLMALQQSLKQRNALLKQIRGVLEGSNRHLMETYDQQIIEGSMKLAKRRAAFVDGFSPYFQQNIEALVPQLESCTILYKTSALEDTFERKFRSALEKDLLLQRTTVGAHRDDFVFLMNARPIKHFGSQGQQKTFLIAIKLAQFDYLGKEKGQQPILLLDDVFDKLDDERIHHLVDLLADHARFEQVIITDAREERTVRFFEDYEDPEIVRIENGMLK